MRTWSDEVFDQGMEVAQENCIRSLMENKGWTMEYAMDALNIKDKKIRREMTNRIETAPGGITRGWLNRLPGDTGGRAGRP